VDSVVHWLTRKAQGFRPVLDVEYLCRLEAHLGEAVVAELLFDGLMELSDRLDRLTRLAESGDHEALGHLGHDLIATAGHLGLSALSIAAADMQRRLREPAGPRGQGPDARNLEIIAAPVRHLTEPSLNALTHHLSSLKAR